ncbi:calcineurin B-like protein 4 [Tanacetum coccineum]
MVLLSRCKPLGYKWIFKKKMKADGTIAKHRARLVIKEFRQREGLDYYNTYYPVTRITSTRMVLAIAALRNLEVYLMDVKPTFLNEDLEEEIYMNQPQGFIAPGLESKVCRLVKSLYDLRKAPKQGYQISPYHVRMRIPYIQACQVELYNSFERCTLRKTDGESVLREAYPTRASFHDLLMFSYLSFILSVLCFYPIRLNVVVTAEDTATSVPT